MTGLDGMEKLLRDIYHIPLIEGTKAPGLLMIAEPGQGKTFAMENIVSNNSIIVNDITGWGVESLLMECIEDKKNYIAIPDLIKVASRPASFKSFLMLYNILLEEGLERVQRFNKSFDAKKLLGKPINIGLVTATTPYNLQKYYKEIEGVGFLSRQLTVSFCYNKTDTEIIEYNIIHSKKIDKVTMEMPESVDPIKVTIPEESKYHSGISRLASYLKKVRGDKFKMRALHQIKSLLLANALANGRKKVNEVDVNELFTLLPFFFVPLLHNSTGKHKDLFNLNPASDSEYYYLRDMMFKESHFGNGKKYPFSEYMKAQKTLRAMGLIEVRDNIATIAKLGDEKTLLKEG